MPFQLLRTTTVAGDIASPTPATGGAIAYVLGEGKHPEDIEGSALSGKELGNIGAKDER